MFAGWLDVLLKTTVTDSVVRLAGIEGEFRLSRRDGWGLGDLVAWLVPTFAAKGGAKDRGTPSPVEIPPRCALAEQPRRGRHMSRYDRSVRYWFLPRWCKVFLFGGVRD